MEKWKIAYPIVFVLIYTLILIRTSVFLTSSRLFPITNNKYLNFQANYQIVLLLVTLVALVLTFIINKENFLSFFKVGKINALAQELKFFGINKNDRWLKTGLSLCLFISLATGFFLYQQWKGDVIHWQHLNSGILWILLFSLTNSFGEEMIYRIAILSPLKGLLSPIIIFCISGVLFGIPHFSGMPSGLIGVIMASVLGFILAKSVYETNGFFWAWVIHFIQDVFIISSLYLMSITKINL